MLLRAIRIYRSRARVHSDTHLRLPTDLSVFFAIKSTSALTFTVFGNLKVVIVILLSVIIFQNEV